MKKIFIIKTLAVSGNQKVRIDLHLHSNNSDGKLKPSEVVKKLVKNKVGFAVLTDHDSVDGSIGFAKNAAQYGIKTVHGVEISASQDDIGLHILGYGINVKDTRLKNLFRKQLLGRKKKFLKTISLFKKAGLHIDRGKLKEILKLKNVGKPHIFSLIYSDPRNKEIFLKKYKFKEDRRTQGRFIDLFMTFPGQLAHVKKDSIKCRDAIKLIHQTGGIAVFAHPGVELELKSKTVFIKILKELVSYGLDGIEAFSYAHTKKQMAHYHKIARRFNLISTIGTDDHDGSRIGKLRVPPKLHQEIFTDLSSKLGS